MATQVSTETLANLRLRVREQADMVNSDFVSEEELTRYIQQSYRKLYNLVITAFGDWYTQDPVSFTISSGNEYTLDTDFYKLVGVDHDYNGNWVEIRSFNFNERNKRNSAPTAYGYHPILRYRLIGDKLRFIPTDQATGDFRYWYIPKPNVPVDDTDTIEGYNGWDQYIVLDAAIKCLVKEETDVTELMQERAQAEQDILINAQTRDEGDTETVEDVSSYYDNSDGDVYW